MDTCPTCGHRWAMHDHSDGCYSGFTYRETDGGNLLVSVSGGCDCRLSHVDDSPQSIGYSEIKTLGLIVD